MKIKLIVVAKTDASYLNEGIQEYEKRLTRYIDYQMVIIPALKNAKKLSEVEQKREEGKKILAELGSNSWLVLLDDKGKEYSSEKFATYLQSKMNAGMKELVFVVGGPYGFSDEVYAQAKEKFSMSKMTFSHQMIRLFFVEQLYRANTILRGEPYHHR